MTYESPLDKFMVGYWAWEGIKKAFNWSIESLIMGNFGFILPAAWVAGLFILKPTRTYAIGSCALWVLVQM